MPNNQYNMAPARSTKLVPAAMIYFLIFLCACFAVSPFEMGFC
jgi:hypothetical protein